jgi:nitrate reductase delta subunit
MKTAKSLSLTLRALARLIDYPDGALRQHFGPLREALQLESALTPARLAQIDALLQGIVAQSAIDAEADYVQLFDSGRRTSLHLFEHVHGDSRDRGPAMIDLGQTYQQAGLNLVDNQLPDYLPAVLEFVSTQPPREARAFLGEIAHIVNAIFCALQHRRSAYACVLGALLDLSGQAAHPVEPAAEEPLDDSWAEPAAFDGCLSKGQSRPGQAQPVRIVRRGASIQGAT